MDQKILELLNIMESERQIYHVLKGCPYELLRRIEVHHYQPGKFHLRQGNVYDTLYLIVGGSAEICVEASNGKRYHLSTYEKGCFIGEMEIFRRAPYVSSVISEKGITLIEIPREILMKLLEADKNFAGVLIRELSNESYDMCRNMAENTLHSLKQRICRYLIAKADSQGNLCSEVRTENLAESLAVTQRSVNRILKELREKELITIDKKGAHILDLEGLKAEMQE